MALTLRLGILSFFLLLSACAERPEPQAPPESSPERRIVSFSPAISRTLVDFGLTDQIVGRTPYCEAVPREIPVTGDLLSVDYERLVRLRPTHVLIQPPAATGVPPPLSDLADRHGWVIGQWRLNDVADVLTLVDELPGILAAPSGRFDLDRDVLIERAAELHSAMARLLEPEPEAIWPGATLFLIGTEPVTAIGTDTFLHELWASLGGVNLIDRRGYPQMTLESLARRGPEAIVFVRPGVSAEADPQRLLGPIARLDLPALDRGRIALLSHEDALMPSTGLIEVAEELRSIMARFREIDRASTSPRGEADPE